MTNINNCILRFRLYFEPFIKLNCLIIIYTFYNIKIQLMDIPIVCAPGSANIKMGFAGDNFPRCSLASVVGRPNMHINSHLSMEDVIIGNKAIKERSLLQLYSPISDGSVRDWEEMKILLKHSFKEIGVKDPRGKSIFIASPIQNSYLNKIEMMDLMFEQFGANRIQFGLQPLMTLFSEGNDTGVVIDIGYSSTRLTKIFEGDILGFENVKIGGLHVVDNFLNLLYQRGYSSRINLDFYTAKQLMQKQCFVAVDLNLEKKIAFQTCIHEKKYILPDKQVIKMGMQRFLAPQILFNFKDKQLEAKGCGDMIVNSIHNSTFYNNIILSGGTSMIPGLSTRLKQDIQLRLKQKYQIEYTKTTINKIRIIDAPNRNDNVFLGCSLIAKETKDFNKAWISKHQYEQKGKTRLAQELCSSLK